MVEDTKLIPPEVTPASCKKDEGDSIAKPEQEMTVLQVLLFEPALTIALLMMLVAQLATGLWFGMIGLFLAQSYSFDSFDLGVLFSVAGMALLIFMGTCIKPIVAFWGETGCIAIGFGIRSFAFGLPVFVKAPWVPYVQFITYCFGDTFVSPCLSSVITKLSPIYLRATFLGILSAVTNIGMTLGPLIGGVLYEMNIYFPCAAASATGELSLKLWKLQISFKFEFVHMLCLNTLLVNATIPKGPPEP